MERKAQADVITTILIILLVLAVIVIVWQVVRSTVEKGAGEIEEKSSCINVNLDVTEAKASDNKVKVTRLAGGTTDEVSVIVLGSSHLLKKYRIPIIATADKIKNCAFLDFNKLRMRNVIN